MTTIKDAPKDPLADENREFDALVTAQSKNLAGLRAALKEQQRLNAQLMGQVLRQTTALAAANAHLRVIFSSMTDVAREIAKAGPEVQPIKEEELPTPKGFMKGLADKIAAAGNGQPT